MKCPECERTGQRSKLYMPTGYISTCMGGTETYYDEDGHRHHHEINRSHGQGSCSLGHILNVTLSDKCPAPNCGYGSPMSMTVVPQTDQPSPECFTVTGTISTLHDLDGAP